MRKKGAERMIEVEEVAQLVPCDKQPNDQTTNLFLELLKLLLLLGLYLFDVFGRLCPSVL
jgi:hypothetical protein